MSAGLIFNIVVFIIVFNYAIGRFLEYLNNSHRSSSLPKKLDGLYNAEKYQKSQEYDKAKTKFGFYSSAFSLFLMLGMLFLDGFAWLDGWLRGYTENPIVLALLFFGCLGFASDILSLPFSVYNTFVIEERFGFNRTTVKTFVLDKFKGWILGGILGGCLLFLFVWFYKYTGQHFWLYAWAAFSAFMLFMTSFFASLILPLFNKLTPMDGGQLRISIEEYCIKVSFKLDNLFVMDGSKRSAKANAFFSGLGAKKKIVLYDTLIKNHTNEELVAVLAHEVGHYKLKHSRTTMIASVLQTGLMLFLLSLVIGSSELSAALGASESSFHLALLVFTFLYSPFSLFLGLGMNVLSRKHEYEADAYARDTYNGDALASALKKLSVDNLSNLLPHPAYVFFYYSHPTLIKRLNTLENGLQSE